MKSIEASAVIVQANTEAGPGSNCRLMADKILENKVSALEKKILAAAQKAFKFLYESRRGFYCALCNQPYHEFIDIYSSSIISSNQFCKSLVENTLNFYMFKFEYFMKLSRLYSLFLITCDFKGSYDKTKYIAYESKFFKEPEILKGLEVCRDKIGDPHGYKYCQEYCSNFNPTKFSEVFEGDIDRLKGFAAYLKNNMEIKQIQYERESAKDVLNMKGRLLEALINRKIEIDHIKERRLTKEKENEKKPAEKKPEAAEGKDATDAGAKEAEKAIPPKQKVDALNAELKSAILNPVNYSFSDDMTIEHSTPFNKSIFHQGFYHTFRLHCYSSQFDRVGINWHSVGKSAKFEKGAVKEVMKMVGPNDIQVRELSFEIVSG